MEMNYMRCVPAIFMGLVLLVFEVKAEGNCPPGYFPIGGPEVQGCAPIPSSGGGLPLDPGPQWATRWGAIAVDGTVSRFGGAEGYSNRRRAEKAAIANCKKNGGTKHCKVPGGAYYNQCGALAWGESKARVFSAGTTEAAQNLALEACSKDTANCKVYYSGCSYPERIR
jgi:hypothetical protein